jgi:hypothetical protein
MIESLLNGDAATAPLPLGVLLLALLLAFLLGQALAWIYIAAHQGISYSRGFVVSLLALPVIVTLVMMVLAHSIVTAFGLMAVFAIVRFRNILRDTLDTVYVLTAIVAGMACGTQKFTTAVIGGAVVGGILLYVRLTSFGSRRRYDYILDVEWTAADAVPLTLEEVLRRHACRAECRQRRAIAETGITALSYHLLLRDPGRVTELLSEVKTLRGIAAISGVPAGDESEV